MELDADWCRALACEALEAGKPMVAHDWANAWKAHGGVRTLGPWLISVASALQLGRPRIAVRAADLALGNWVSESTSRAVLLYVRGEVIRRHLRDPKTAQADLDTCQVHAPAWLRADALSARTTCHAEAAASRKRKASVDPAPEYIAPVYHPYAAQPVIDLDPEIALDPPFVWPAVKRVLAAPDPRVPEKNRWDR